MPLKLTALDESIMLTIRHEPKYGLQIMDEYEQTGEHVPDSLSSFRNHLASGNLYPTLKKLTKKGFIQVQRIEVGSQSRKNHRQKYYKITPKGECALKYLEDTRARLEHWSLNDSYSLI